MNNLKYLLTIALCFCLTAVFAQVRISGNVSSKLDGPIIMANVVEIDANNRFVSATTTDMSGNFSLNIKNTKNSLQVSYPGYKTYKHVIGTQKVFKINLIDKSVLSGATVVGKRIDKSNGMDIPEREISVAQQTLDMDEMEGLSFETAGEALQGQIAGLDVVVNSGNLGAGTSMRLRGVSTINGSQEPLIVVDNYILTDYNSNDVDFTDIDNQEQFANLLQVDPTDIQSIKVLQDASATAIWGSDGANGVIEIKTRRGRRGATKVNFTYRFNGSWQPDGMKMLDGDGYSMMLKEGYFNPNQSDLASGIVELMYKRDRTAYFANFNKNTDWVDEVTQFGQSHKYGISITGGGEKARFRVSGNYDKETGTIIKQSLDRFSTRLALDYYVSDRIKFSSNFSLTFIDNMKNNGAILNKAYNAMPNMSVYNYAYDKATQEYYNTGEYMLMFPKYGSKGIVPDGYTSYYLGDMVNYGNPVAIANKAWIKESTYRINPQFSVEYKLLGKDDVETQLNYTGEVYLNAFTKSNKAYYPAELTTNTWSQNINTGSNTENKSLDFRTKHSLLFRPHFENRDHALMFLVRGELGTINSTSQYMASSGISGGISDPTVLAYLTGANSSTSKSHSMSGIFTSHYAYKSRLSFDFTLRADGSTLFGSSNKWGFFPGISGRWNISDENFMKPIKNTISMLAIRAGWGVNGSTGNLTSGTMYNKYKSIGVYGNSSNYISAIAPSGLRLVSIKWQKTKAWNLGTNLGIANLISLNFNVYSKKTSDLINNNVGIPSSVGYSSISSANVGEIKNQGWDLFLTANRILHAGKFYMNVRANMAQNINEIVSMDPTVLASNNSDFNYANANNNILYRVQVGNALGGIYGFRFKGVYRYDYDHSGYFQNEDLNTQFGDYTKEHGSPTAAIAESRNENATCPVARDAQGNIIYDASGNPLHMYYNYGGQNYQFKGGDVIYEDMNNDGQINELDVVYLGNSNPTFNGGFGVDLVYDRWMLKANFSFRVGNKIINKARLIAESMRTNSNQSAAVNWRWRKNGDITEIPRAMNSNAGASYNAMINDRYVEKGDYLRLNNLQLSYGFDPAKLKRYGLSSLRMSASGNNLIFWSKYSGVDPEHSASGISPAIDNSQTPRSRSFTFSLTLGF